MASCEVRSIRSTKFSLTSRLDFRHVKHNKQFSTERSKGTLSEDSIRKKGMIKLFHDLHALIYHSVSIIRIRLAISNFFYFRLFLRSVQAAVTR